MIAASSKLIMEFLDSSGYGTAGVDIFAMEWGNVDSQILIIDNPSMPSEVILTYEEVSFQVLVRGEKNEDINITYEKMRSIYELLITASTPDLDAIITQSPPYSLGRDENDRAIYTTTFLSYRNAI